MCVASTASSSKSGSSVWAAVARVVAILVLRASRERRLACLRSSGTKTAACARGSAAGRRPRQSPLVSAKALLKKFKAVPDEADLQSLERLTLLRPVAFAVKPVFIFDGRGRVSTSTGFLAAMRRGARTGVSKRRDLASTRVLRLSACCSIRL